MVALLNGFAESPSRRICEKRGVLVEARRSGSLPTGLIPDGRLAGHLVRNLEVDPIIPAQIRAGESLIGISKFLIVDRRFSVATEILLA